MPPRPAKLSQRDGPRPGHFIVRPTGEIVPLIAADELPPGFDLVGAPRAFGDSETIGMMNLGIERGSGAFYKVVQPQHATSPVEEKLPGSTKLLSLRDGEVIYRSDHQKSPTTSPSSSTSSSTKVESNPGPSNFSTSSLRSSCASHGESSTSSVSSGPSNIARQPTKLQICRHWCKHGTCRWGLGCNHRHIMPLTLSGLYNVGLYDWPTWYRKSNPGYFVGKDKDGEEKSIALGRPQMTSNRAMGGCPRKDCCGGMSTHGKRLRTRAEKTLVRDIAAIKKREERGEQVIARLRGIHATERSKTEGYPTKLDSSSEAMAMVKLLAERSANARIERAAARDAKVWEEEVGEAEEERGPEEDDAAVDEGMRGKLVDV